MKRLVRAGVLRVPVRYDKPIVHGKPIIHVVLHWSHCNRGMFLGCLHRVAFPFQYGPWKTCRGNGPTALAECLCRPNESPSNCCEVLLTCSRSPELNGKEHGNCCMNSRCPGLGGAGNGCH